MHVIIGLAVIKIQNINKSLISLVGLHFLAAQHLQSTLHNQPFWHHGGKVPAIKLALGVAILTHRTSFLANNVSTTIVRYSVEWPVNLLSASWFVSEMSVKLSYTPLTLMMSGCRNCRWGEHLEGSLTVISVWYVVNNNAHARMITASKCLSTVRNCQMHQHIVLSDLTQ